MRKILFSAIFSALCFAATIAQTTPSALQIFIDSYTIKLGNSTFLVNSSSRNTALEGYATPLPAGLLFVLKYDAVSAVKVTDGVSLFATLPDLATTVSSGAMDLTTAQTAAGLKTFSDGISSASNVTISGGNIRPSSNLTRSVGESGANFLTAYIASYLSSGTMTIGPASSGFAIDFRQGNTSSSNVFGILADGRAYLQSAGSRPTSDGANLLQVAGSIKATQFRLSANNTAPSSASDTGTAGEIRVTGGYIYYCPSANTWVRAALATW